MAVSLQCHHSRQRVCRRCSPGLREWTQDVEEIRRQNSGTLWIVSGLVKPLGYCRVEVVAGCGARDIPGHGRPRQIFPFTDNSTPDI